MTDDRKIHREHERRLKWVGDTGTRKWVGTEKKKKESLPCGPSGGIDGKRLSARCLNCRFVLKSEGRQMMHWRTSDIPPRDGK